ncbi:MAG TPA: CpaD family pilus assembly lipoprotein [Allosphingosinicella sp.]|jgi:pilus assembly protein CpaD|nr:CpaD family pilus assembly lipoprotein [Allosphingosinicella sp.]
MARKTLFALIVIGAAFSASAADARHRNSRDDNWGLYSYNQPVVQRADYVLELANPGPGLPVAERARLRAWFASLGLGYGDRVAVESIYGNDPVRADVARIAAEYGLLLSDSAPIVAGRPEAGAVRVIVSRSFAHVPGCPFADSHQGPSATSSNYGCSVNSNLAAMIADPNDLVLGEAGSASGDPATAAKAIRTYRDAKPTGANGLQAASAKGSN